MKSPSDPDRHCIEIVKITIVNYYLLVPLSSLFLLPFLSVCFGCCGYCMFVLFCFETGVSSCIPHLSEILHRADWPQTYVSPPVCVEARGCYQVSWLIALDFTFLDRNSLRTRSSSVWLSCLDRELQDSPCLCMPPPKVGLQVPPPCPVFPSSGL